MAERRKQALLASGVQIEGLQQVSSNGAPRKVVYGSRKKKGPEVRDASPAPPSRPLSPEPVYQLVSQPLDNDGVKSDWDVSSNDGESKVPGVKESWDASSDEDLPQPAPAPTTSLPQSVPQGI
jgi:translation initiation factor 5B